MKIIEKEIVTKSKETVYVANDGTEFTNESECRKYEKSARGVLFAKYAPMVSKTTDEESFFHTGSCDSVVEIVSLKNQADADLILQILFLENSWYTSDEERKADTVSTVNSAIGDFLAIGRGFDKESFWLYGSRKSILEDLDEEFKGI